MDARTDEGRRRRGNCLERWLATDPAHAVLLLPHDFKPDPVGDIGPLRRLEARLQPLFTERVHYVVPPFNAWEAKALGGEADFTIACLGMGPSALGIVYQGKFEGLMDHFGLDNMPITPDQAADPEELFSRLQMVEAHLPELRAQIATRLPEVMILSKRNFDWLRKG